MIDGPEANCVPVRSRRHYWTITTTTTTQRRFTTYPTIRIPMLPLPEEHWELPPPPRAPRADLCPVVIVDLIHDLRVAAVVQIVPRRMAALAVRRSPSCTTMTTTTTITSPITTCIRMATTSVARCICRVPDLVACRAVAVIRVTRRDRAAAAWARAVAVVVPRTRMTTSRWRFACGTCRFGVRTRR